MITLFDLCALWAAALAAGRLPTVAAPTRGDMDEEPSGSCTEALPGHDRGWASGTIPLSTTLS